MTVQLEVQAGGRNPHYQPRRLRWDYIAVRGVPEGTVGRVTYDHDGVLEITFSSDPSQTFDPAVGDREIGPGEAYVVECEERIDPEWAARVLMDAYRREGSAHGVTDCKSWENIEAPYKKTLIDALRYDLDEIMTAAKQRQRAVHARIERAFGAMAEVPA